ncbi:hypothetical protein MUK42_04747 [Musa troglodytarum]|nr:hypothetical protein MUK42_04747 [Musa troglodytarum]
METKKTVSHRPGELAWTRRTRKILITMDPQSTNQRWHLIVMKIRLQIISQQFTSPVPAKNQQ